MGEYLRLSMMRVTTVLLTVLVFLSISHQSEASGAAASVPDLQVNQLAQIIFPPRLSDQELGIHLSECEPTQSPAINAVEGEDYYCGVFTVPQNWEEPDGRNLDLSFMVVEATGKQPASDALLFLSGGPGQNANLKPIGSYQNLRTDRDIVLLDQRGTGFSQRLGWEECLVLALQNDAPPDQVEALRAAAYNPLEEGSTPLKLNELDIRALNETCWDQFAEHGLDLNQFTTAASARDVVELLKALNYDSFNLHGVSYGTRLAMTIMAKLPEYNDAPVLRSVVLDSTFPPSIYLISSLPRNNHDFMLQLLAECQADAACRQAYPNLAMRLITLLNRLVEEPLSANGEVVTLDDFISQLATVGASQAGYLPKMISELEVNVLETYLSLRDGTAGTDLPENFPGDLDLNDPVQSFISDAYYTVGGGLVGLELIVYLNFSFVNADPQRTLQAIAEEAFTGDVVDQLVTKLSQLTAEEITNSPYVQKLQADFAAEAGIGDPEDLARLQLAIQRQSVVSRLAQPLFNTIHCAEDIQFERFEDAVNTFNDLAFPQLSNLDTSKTQANLCQKWPVKAAPIQVKDPVSSTVPALILQGAYDMRTPVYMGKRAARELSNSIYVLVPQQGHEVWTRSGDCVGGIATAFIQAPDATIDLSCLDKRRPSWALPDDADKSQLAPE
jgi:pimeloyl-ACP methyl ester carboxylesterase